MMKNNNKLEQHNKNICFITSTLSYGGATKILIEVANYLSTTMNVSIIYYGKDKAFYQIDDRIEVIQIPQGVCQIPRLRFLFQAYKIRKEVKKHCIDAVIAFGNKDKLLAVISTIFSKRKSIISERQDPYNYIPGKKHYMWGRYILSDGCIFQTEGAMRYFPKSVQKKSIVINNFIHECDFSFIPFVEKEKEIAFVARFELRQKRQDLMVEAFRSIVDKHNEWRLCFYGDGEDEVKIKDLVKKYGIEEYVIFKGKESNTTLRIRESAVLALTSDFEGIPNVILEAMAVGTPVVTTDCNPGGAKLLIQDGENGFITERGNSAQIADKINYLIEHPEIADTFSLRSLEDVKKYYPNNILPIWKKYIEGMIKE